MNITINTPLQFQKVQTPNFGAGYIKPMTKVVKDVCELPKMRETVTNKTKVTKGDFIKVFYDPNLSVSEKVEALNIRRDKLYAWGKILKLKAINALKIERIASITKEEFLKVHLLDIPEKEKPARLGLSAHSYRLKRIEFKLETRRSRARKRVIEMKPSKYNKVFDNPMLTEAQKHSKLKIGSNSFYDIARSSNRKTKKMAKLEYINSITKEVFDSVYFDKNLKYNEKCKKLNVSSSAFNRLTRKFGYVPKLKRCIEKVNNITKRAYDKVFYDKDLNLKEKSLALDVTHITFKTLGIKFGHAEEMGIKPTVPIQVFDRVYHDKTLSAKEKRLKLHLSQAQYYQHIMLYGYKTDRQKVRAYNSNISDELVTSVVNNPNLKDSEKRKILGYHNKMTYYKGLQERNISTERQKSMQHCYNITREAFEKVYNDASLSELEKHKALSLSSAQYLRVAGVFGYKTKTQLKREFIATLTEAEFKKIHYDPNLTRAEKCKRLHNISGSTYHLLCKKFNCE